MTDPLERWAAARAKDLVARAEAEAVADVEKTLRRSLLNAVQSELARASDEARAGDEAEERAADPAPAPPMKTRESDVRSTPVVPDQMVEADAAGEGLWAYCVVRENEGTQVRGTPGVDRAHSVELVRHAGLATLVSRVPLAEFGEEPLKQNLNDLNWLQNVAQAHQSVLDRAFAETTIVPLRLCTIYENEEHVREMLQDECSRISALLDALAGRSEWGVKLLVDPAALRRAAVGQAGDTAGSRREEEESGGAYLTRRREERAGREATEKYAGELAEEVHARLQDWATDAIVNPPQNRELSHHEGEMLLNGAYLVEDERVERFATLVEELEERHRGLGARLELTGPWPPFNFIPRLEEARA